MDLENFIVQTLIAIRAGVRKANDEIVAKNLNSEHPFHLGQIGKDVIEFDVAVSAENDNSKKAGGGLMISVLNLGGDTENRLKNANASRIKFKIYLSYNHMS